MNQDWTSARIRIGVVDSGHAAAQVPHVAASAAFVLDGGEPRRVPAEPDRLGHGSRVGDGLLHCLPQAELLVAQVFRERLATSAAQVAAAIDWLVDEDARLINLSLGLREPRPVLAAACARALAAGVVLCASAPARGQPVYPAGFPGVLRVTGDARCMVPTEIAALGAAHADYGAHVRPLDGSLDGAGASMACAWLSGMAARHLAAGGSAASLPGWLAAQARYHGVEDLESLKREKLKHGH
ncbi:S8 family serine peptidase [Thauera butanivorans]|uniref:subtilisin-like serine protease QhpE n=1 Tax=Thauera butanivorans TaxID=86174 RepID=UPI003AB194B2